MQRFESRNVFGRPLEPCGTDPVTGFYRDGDCATGHDDQGIHTVCAELTEEFLEFRARKGTTSAHPTRHSGSRV